MQFLSKIPRRISRKSEISDWLISEQGIFITCWSAQCQRFEIESFEDDEIERESNLLASYKFSNFLHTDTNIRKFLHETFAVLSTTSRNTLVNWIASNESRSRVVECQQSEVESLEGNEIERWAKFPFPCETTPLVSRVTGENVTTDTAATGRAFSCMHTDCSTFSEADLQFVSHERSHDFRVSLSETDGEKRG